MKELDRKLKEFHDSGREVKILDIGGWWAPCRQATHMIDLMPFETMNRSGAYGYGELRITRENYLQTDICATDRFPFKDKEFDFIVCRHTLEDVKDPIQVCREMIRIGKAGYIETPSRVCESTKGIERHWWCGYYHHRWFIQVEGNRITFQFKPHNLHSSRKFYFRCWPWQKIRKTFETTHLMWEDSFDYGEKLIIDYGDVKRDLTDFKRSHSGDRLFRMRWAED